MKDYDKRRYNYTLQFLKTYLKEDSKLLDLGIQNDLSRFLIQQGYAVENTKGENLDFDYKGYTNLGVDAVCAFEIFEHMFAPYNFLKELKTPKLFASVPLKLWFSEAYWNEKDEWDKHYHEFEPKQFDYLLKATGWKIVDSIKWASYDNKIVGIRPLLRRFTPRYYLVYCERV